jgi:hypothetical protein
LEGFLCGFRLAFHLSPSPPLQHTIRDHRQQSGKQGNYREDHEYPVDGVHQRLEKVVKLWIVAAKRDIFLRGNG